MISIFAFVISFATAVLLVPLFRRIAIRTQLVDEPGGRKIHKEVTPLLGGAGIFCAVMAGMTVKANYFSSLLPLLGAAALIFLFGLLEDIKQGISAKLRFILQLLPAVIVITSGMRITFLPNTLFGQVAEVSITLLWLLGVTNAYNYLDGLDGLAAGSAIVNLFFFILILYSGAQYQIGFLCVCLLGACLGFLPYNFSKKRKIFLGEAGSMFIGFMLAGIALKGNWAEDNLVKIFIPILVLGVPIFDMIFTTIMRFKEEKVHTIGQWLKYGGKDHFHHYLVDLGLKPLGAVFFIYFTTFSLGISAVLVSNDVAAEGILSLLQAFIIFVIIATLMVVGKRRRTGWK